MVAETTDAEIQKYIESLEKLRANLQDACAEVGIVEQAMRDFDDADDEFQRFYAAVRGVESAELNLSVEPILSEMVDVLGMMDRLIGAPFTCYDHDHGWGRWNDVAEKLWGMRLITRQHILPALDQAIEDLKAKAGEKMPEMCEIPHIDPLP